MISGITIAMGGHDYVVAPLTLGQLRRLAPKIEALRPGASDSEQVMDAICEIVHAALSRNYPDIPPERVPELIDLGNRDQIIKAVLGGSGLVPGEAAAVARSNGTGSMDSSPPPAATPIQ
jgi:hypothetical protein